MPPQPTHPHASGTMQLVCEVNPGKAPDRGMVVEGMDLLTYTLCQAVAAVWQRWLGSPGREEGFAVAETLWGRMCLTFCWQKTPFF